MAGYSDTSKPQAQEEMQSGPDGSVGINYPSQQSQSQNYADSELLILFSTLRELRGISASWEGKNECDSSPGGVYINTSASGSNGESNYADTSRDNSNQDSNSNDNSGGNSNDSNDENSSNIGSDKGPEGSMVPSAGSQLHNRGECRPCIYACKNKCQAGSQCLFCHFPHEMPKRPGKNARRRAMARIRRDECDGSEEGKNDDNGEGQSNAADQNPGQNNA
jgi:hypothetical protein